LGDRKEKAVYHIRRPSVDFLEFAISAVLSADIGVSVMPLSPCRVHIQLPAFPSVSGDLGVSLSALAALTGVVNPALLTHR
jgi:hypothetical protein